MKIQKQRIMPAMLTYHDGSKKSLFIDYKFHISVLQFQNSIRSKSTVTETFCNSNLRCHWLILYRLYLFQPRAPWSFMTRK